MDKIRIVTRCTDGCKHCEWMFGSPRCLHSDMKTRNTEDDPCDPCLYQKVPTDSRMFHPDCPLDADTIKINIVKELAENGCRGITCVGCPALEESALCNALNDLNPLPHKHENEDTPTPHTP